MTRWAFMAAVATCVTLAACNKAEGPAAAVSEAEATKLADAMVKAWESRNPARIKSIYAPSIVAFDYAAGPLEADRATFDKAQDVFAQAGIDSEEQIARKIQLIDANTFIVSGVWNGTSKDHPENNGQVRCTDVFHKAPGGDWGIVNEHCSVMPKA